MVEKEIKAVNSQPVVSVVEPTVALELDGGGGTDDISATDEGGIPKEEPKRSNLLLVSSEVTSTPEVCKA
jgi:hypothetical protein